MTAKVIVFPMFRLKSETKILDNNDKKEVINPHVSP